MGRVQILEVPHELAVVSCLESSRHVDFYCFMDINILLSYFMCTEEEEFWFHKLIVLGSGTVGAAIVAAVAETVTIVAVTSGGIVGLGFGFGCYKIMSDFWGNINDI